MQIVHGVKVNSFKHVGGHISLDGQNLHSNLGGARIMYRKQVPNIKLSLFFAINLASKITLNLERTNN